MDNMDKKTILTQIEQKQYMDLLSKLLDPQGEYKYTINELAVICDCDEKTIKKVINPEKLKSNIKAVPRINYMLKAEENHCLTKGYIEELVDFFDIKEQYENYAFDHIGENFSSVNEAFLYMFNYIEAAYEKGEDIKNVIDDIRDHMCNFHMEYNPYYALMRGSFNKELRPLIDFNIDYDEKKVLDLTIHTLRSAWHNPKADKYDLEYKKRMDKIIREKKQCGKIALPSSRREMSFDQFVVLMKEFKASYEPGDIRFLMYDETLVGKMDYVKSNLKYKAAKDIKDDLKFYNLARMFSNNGYYMPIEEVMCNYNFDKLWGEKNNCKGSEARDKYINKLYQSVKFRVKELDKLVTMVAMLDLQSNKKTNAIAEKTYTKSNKATSNEESNKFVPTTLNKERVTKYKSFLSTMKKWGFSESAIARYCQCARGTLDKIEAYNDNSNSALSSEKIIDRLIDNQDKLDIKFFEQLDNFNEIQKKYFALMKKDYALDLNPLNEAFNYAMRYITKGAKKGENIQEVIDKITLHMHNFHMKVNPYYYLMRGYFNKEVRPIIDFNIDRETNKISKLTIHALSTRYRNIKAGEYDLDYEGKMTKIVKDSMRGEFVPFVGKSENSFYDAKEQEKVGNNTGTYVHKISFAELEELLAKRESKVKEEIEKEMSFEEFVDLLYKFTSYRIKDENGEEKEYHIRFLMYDSENKIEYIKDYFDKNGKQDVSEKLKFYNLVRLFRVDDESISLEEVLRRYHLEEVYAMDKKADTEDDRRPYMDQIEDTPQFRLEELDKLIVMVCGLGNEPRDWEKIVLGEDPESGESNQLKLYKNQLQLDRIEEIKARQANYKRKGVDEKGN